MGYIANDGWEYSLWGDSTVTATKASRINEYLFEVREDGTFFDSINKNEIFIDWTSELGKALTYEIQHSTAEFLEKTNFGKIKLPK